MQISRCITYKRLQFELLRYKCWNVSMAIPPDDVFLYDSQQSMRQIKSSDVFDTDIDYDVPRY